jgi:hypothetical protein
MHVSRKVGRRRALVYASADISARKSDFPSKPMPAMAFDIRHDGDKACRHF